MREIKINKVNEIIYEEKLENGLTIFLYKKPDFQNKFAFFQTRYGAIDNEFIPNEEKDYKKYPLGIAHFLEHKLFESNDDSNVFELFEKNGSYVNAATSYDKTYYYFSTVDNFESSLKTLIDFVQSPYFTDENVEKEKGIIEQEIDMVNDDPSRFLFQKLISNVLVESNYKEDIAGSKESIAKITKEDLYECYNTFYNPSNMFLVIAGDIDINKTIEIIKENQANKKLEGVKQVKRKRVIEPDFVNKKYEEFVHNVESQKVGYCYKINLPRLERDKKFLFLRYVDIYFKILFGDTSDFSDNLIKDKIVKSYFSYDYEMLKNENYNLLLYFTANVIDKAAFEKKLKEALNKRDNMKELFDLWKKNYVSHYVLSFDSLESVVSFIRINYNEFGEVPNNIYDLVSSLNYDDFKKVINFLHYDNYCEVILKPTKE